jgi:mannose-6-phosphate isomerase-like protein (cupin superfamily)
MVDVIRFRDQKLAAHVAHAGIGHIFAHRAASPANGLNGHFIDCVVMPPGTSIGVHTHESDNEEVYIILKGRGRMTIGTTERDVEHGDVIVNPPGGTHGLYNQGPENIELIVIEYGVLGNQRSE